MSDPFLAHPLIQKSISRDESVEYPPSTYHIAAFNAFRLAADLSRSALALSGLSYIPNQEVAEDKRASRNAVFGIAYKLLMAERDRAMDIAVKHWLKYRTMEPEETPND